VQKPNRKLITRAKVGDYSQTTEMRNIRIYVLMVGTPLLGVALVLYLGQRIRPQSYVGGAWNLELDAVALSSSPCAELLTTLKQPALNISQSGRHLLVRLNNRAETTVEGQIRGTTLRAGPTSGFEPGSTCDGKNSVNLVGELNKTTPLQVQLNGELQIAGCAACAPVAFKAIR